MSKELSRRDFLKITSGTSASVALATCMPGTLGAIGAKALTGSEKFIGSICEMCSSRCPISAKVVSAKNGQLKNVFIDGNPLYKGTGGTVCARGGAGHNQLYDPNRLVKPLKRVGDRGVTTKENWKEISWEEAYTEIAKKLSSIKENFGPQSVVFTAKTGEHHTHMKAFASAYGSPNSFSHWSSCPITYSIAGPHTFGGSLVRDFANSKFILNFGHNLFEGIDIEMTRALAKAGENNTCKLVVLEPRFSVVASKADEWLPVKPGTDLAFILSLIHVWLRDSKYDKKFVEKYTVGLEELKEATKDTTPLWQEKITGIPASTAERIANEIYQASPSCIIDYGHKTTTTTAEYQRTRAIFVANALMGNLEKKGGMYFAKNAAAINKLAQENVIPSLANPLATIKTPKTQRVDRAGEDGRSKFIPSGHGVLQDIAPAILSSDPYPVKGWVAIRHNPLVNVSDVNQTIEALTKKDNNGNYALDFVLAIDVYISDFACYADIILPESTYLERDEAIMGKNGKAPGYYMRSKVVEPIGDTKPNWQIFRELASLLNVDQDYTWKDMREYRMQQAKGNEKLLASLMQNGYVSFGVPELLYRDKKSVAEFVSKYPQSAQFLDEDGLFGSMISEFKTPSKKIEIFSQQVEDAFPGYGTPRAVNMDVFNGYTYAMISGKTAIHTNGHTQNIPMLNDLMSDAPVWMHTRTAEILKLKSGDKIILSNKVGQQEGTVMVTEGIREDTLFVYHGFGRISPYKNIQGIGVNQSRLLPNVVGEVCCTMVTNAGVEIRKA